MRVIPLALLMVTAPAAAQPLSPEFLRCAGIARDADRLACYDKAVAASSAEARRFVEARQVESARIAAAEAAAAAAAAKARREAEIAARKDAFGGAAIGKTAPASETDVTEIDTTLTEVLTDTSGLGVFVLGNGQMWRQTDSAGVPRVRPGEAVKLTRAPLGGYRLTLARNGRWVTVKRVR